MAVRTPSKPQIRFLITSKDVCSSSARDVETEKSKIVFRSLMAELMSFELAAFFYINNSEYIFVQHTEQASDVNRNQSVCPSRMKLMMSSDLHKLLLKWGEKYVTANMKYMRMKHESIRIIEIENYIKFHFSLAFFHFLFIYTCTYVYVYVSQLMPSLGDGQ